MTPKTIPILADQYSECKTMRNITSLDKLTKEQNRTQLYLYLIVRVTDTSESLCTFEKKTQVAGIDIRTQVCNPSSSKE